MEKKGNKSLLKNSIFTLIFILVILGSYFLGYIQGYQKVGFPQVLVTKIFDRDYGQPKDIDFSLFWEVWNRVNAKFDGQTNPNSMVYGAIRGMVHSLGDPYTVFMDPEENKIFSEDIDANFEGIGAEISEKNNQPIIVAPLARYPADKAGLKPGDVILKINNEDISGLNLDQIIAKIRGPAGTEVTLTIERKGWKESKDFKIIREKIEIKSVTWEFKDNFAIIKINQFIKDDTEPLLDKAITEINQKKPKGIILDLRNNPGGYLDTSISVASEFIKDGVVVISQEKSGKREEYKANKSARLVGYPLVILINKGSASASEIVAGAIKDYKVGKLVGEKTFGKGTVQDYEDDLPQKAGLRITTAHWLTPLGKSIDKEGIEPDEKVELTLDQEEKGIDTQLDKALEILKKK